MFRRKDTQGIIRHRNLKDRQYNEQEENQKPIVHNTLHSKLKIAQHKPGEILVIFGKIFKVVDYETKFKQ